MENKTFHYFIAVPIPMEAKEQISKKSEQIKQWYPFKKWVHKEDLHITLAFLGASSKEKYVKCMNELKVLLRDTSAFTLRLSEIGTFGLIEKPRILWCGPCEQDQLTVLQEIVSSCCLTNSFQLDTRKFNPHVTLARKYEGKTIFTETDLDKCGNLFKKGIQFQVNAVSLFETHIDQLPKYKMLDSIKLK